ncbi:MAG TPA: hypothetical protein VNN77_08065 [candidate division Zixibacteria bacterium]|nr:hypothetical protein [candidate division Zixibacteria bacterium]
MKRIKMAAVSVAFLFLGWGPFQASGHDGPIDVYGCHYGEGRREYHCHEGMFKGGSFDSRVEMVRRLKLQYLNMGRRWPYGDLVEEDITQERPEQGLEK